MGVDPKDPWAKSGPLCRKNGGPAGRRPNYFYFSFLMKLHVEINNNVMTFPKLQMVWQHLRTDTHSSIASFLFVSYTLENTFLSYFLPI